MMQDALARQLPRLRYLAVIDQAGSLGQAAKRLKMSPSALSEAVRLVEGAVGAPVLVRGCRGVRLTEVGVKLKAFAEEMDGALQALERELDGRVLGPRRVKLWTKEPFAAAFWPHYLKAVRELPAGAGAAKQPAMSLELKISRSNREIEAALRLDDEAVALVAEPDYSSEIELYEVFRDAWALHGIPGEPAPRGRGPKAPLKAFWFRAAVSGPSRSLGDWLSDTKQDTAGLELVDVDSLAVAAELALAGEGLALLPTEYVRLSGALRGLSRYVPEEGEAQVPQFPDLRLFLAAPAIAGDSGAVARTLLRIIRGIHEGAVQPTATANGATSVRAGASSRASGREPVLISTC
jgi:DNA-binding transcriptional LysR family regulator